MTTNPKNIAKVKKITQTSMEIQVFLRFPVDYVTSRCSAGTDQIIMIRDILKGDSILAIP